MQRLYQLNSQLCVRVPSLLRRPQGLLQADRALPVRALRDPSQAPETLGFVKIPAQTPRARGRRLRGSTAVPSPPHDDVALRIASLLAAERG